MADDNQRLNFITRLDNTQLKSDAEEAKKAISGIETNTQNLARLTKIEVDIASMKVSLDGVKSGIDNMNLRGIKLHQ